MQICLFSHKALWCTLQSHFTDGKTEAEWTYWFPKATWLVNSGSEWKPHLTSTQMKAYSSASSCVSCLCLNRQATEPSRVQWDLQLLSQEMEFILQSEFLNQGWLCGLDQLGQGQAEATLCQVSEWVSRGIKAFSCSLLPFLSLSPSHTHTYT